MDGLEINSADIIAALAALSVLALLAFIYQLYQARDPMKGRIAALQGRREELRAGLVKPKRRRSVIRKVDGVTLLRQLAGRLKLLQNEQTKKLTTLLAQAGYRSRDALVYYQVARLTLPLLMGLVGLTIFYGLGWWASAENMYPVLSIGMVFFGLKAPDIFLANTKQKRTDAIRKGLPDALDLMVVCAEAGLTLDAALNRVARELAPATPELADEFSLAAVELSFLPERRQALINLSERVDLASLRGVITTLIQSEKYGTPLATALRVLSAEFRNERLMMAEEKAARLPATLTVPLILFILPCLFIVLMGPAACKISDEFVNM